jgi:hypothetical protein
LVYNKNIGLPKVHDWRNRNGLSADKTGLTRKIITNSVSNQTKIINHRGKKAKLNFRY